MKIAIAQIQSFPGNIDANIGRHRQCIALALEYQADAIFFPELSLTAYEPTLAARQAMTPSEPGLEIFQQISDQKGITIGLGLPVKSAPLPQIGLLLFRPGRSRLLYGKQFLHPDELPFFTPGSNAFTWVDIPQPTALAVCYEISVPAHLEAIRRSEVSIYLASVAKFLSGIEQAHQRLAQIAEQLGVPVLMSNAVGEADGGMCAGKSAAWDQDGQMVMQMDEREEGILIFDTTKGRATKTSLIQG